MTHGRPVRRGQRPTGQRLLRLYPETWRARYQDEMLALLEQVGLSRRARVDLIRGAVDSRVHGSGRIPAVAALVAGALWTFAGTTLLGLASPADWPGYTADVLPLALFAVLASIPALVGCWAVGGDAMGRSGTLAIAGAVVAQAVWAGALVVALFGGAYGWPTAVAHVAGVLGLILLGWACLRFGHDHAGVLLVGAAPLMLVAWAVAWMLFGLGWTLIGVVLLNRDDGGSVRAAPD
jgi:hypothetical protein